MRLISWLLTLATGSSLAARPSSRSPRKQLPARRLSLERLEDRFCPATAGYSVTDLGSLGGYPSYAFDINAAGQVVGEAYSTRPMPSTPS